MIDDDLPKGKIVDAFIIIIITCTNGATTPEGSGVSEFS